MSRNTAQDVRELEPWPLPEGTSEDYIDCSDSCGLNWHVLRAGQPDKPLILFCHGFPELSFSWRKILPKIAGKGFHCVAMDQRGYGRTTCSDDGLPFDKVDLTQYTMTNLVRDLVCLVYKLGYTQVHCIIGHDFGGMSSAMAALMRPDIFLSTVQMSHPYKPPPPPAFGSDPVKKPVDIQAELAALNPPLKHYKYYNSTPPAASHWDNPEQGLETYLRGYFHLKSGDWACNANTRPLTSWSGEALRNMPQYYIMPLNETFPEVICSNMAHEDVHKTEPWLTPQDLQVYVSEWSRTGFQGALNWYRAQTQSTPQSAKDLFLYAGKRIEVPVTFISGQRDWGNYQQPGAVEGYESEENVAKGCWRGKTLVEGAGHWVQQEESEEVVEALTKFLNSL
nr:hypothetical protein B0A51_16560 [Rachicladosporium sp. CCFEE 5018]